MTVGRLTVVMVAIGAASPTISAQRAGPYAIPSYAGTDARGIPHYVARPFTTKERRLLRDAFGIEDPTRLYLSDSTADRLLKYDTRVKECARCYVNSYRVGFISIRHRGESWDQLERRVRRMPLPRFSLGDRSAQASTSLLDPVIRREVETMLSAARRAGFKLRVTWTYRSPSAEAYEMARGGGHTHTLTSLHSYGRALDVVVGDGVLRHARTRQRWVAFRRWVTRYRGDEFRIIGRPDRSWDWPHIEIPSATVGFRTVEEALQRAQQCLAVSASIACDFSPNLPH